MSVNDLKAGMVIIFSKVPPASYLSAGTKYRVEHIGKRDVNFRNVERETGTFDSRSLLKLAVFEVAR